MPALFGGIRAPSTLGSHLRSFTWGNVLPAGEGAAGCCWRAGPAGAAAARHGHAGIRRYRLDAETGLRAPEAGRRFGHTKIQGKSLLVRGLNALAATISTPLARAGDRRHPAARRQRDLRPRRGPLRRRGHRHRPGLPGAPGRSWCGRTRRFTPRRSSARSAAAGAVLLGHRAHEPAGRARPSPPSPRTPGRHPLPARDLG